MEYRVFYCIAAALNSIDRLNEALQCANHGENLRVALTRFAEAEGQELKLRK